MKKQLLIIGKTPPPIGGVTVHLSRLLDNLRKAKISHQYWELKIRTLIFIFGAGFVYKVIHLHANNSFVLMLVSIVAKLTPTSLVITYHCNLGAYSVLRNIANSISIYLCDVPVVLNSQSLQKAKKINPCAQLISAFIPFGEEQPNSDLVAQITDFASSYQTIFCTNAYSVAFDEKGHEVYGITDLIHLFKKLPDAGLVFLDPSGKYAQFLHSVGCVPGPNIFLLKGENSFIDVIKFSDVVIRSTTTDGDSLSVKESLYLNKHVIASDCVDRPEGVVLFHTNNMEDLLRKCELFMCDKVRPPRDHVNFEGAVPALLSVYSSLTQHQIKY